MEDVENFSALGMHTVGGFLVVPVNAELDDNYAVGLQKAVLRKVNETAAKGVLFDVSVLRIVDAYSFSVLTNTAKMVAMLGADMVFVGFQPGVASAAVDLGLDLGNIPTAISMDDGSAFLRNRALQRFGPEESKSGP